jgi:hypothetical protein
VPRDYENHIKAGGQSRSRAMYRKMLKEKYGADWKAHFWALPNKDK